MIHFERVSHFTGHSMNFVSFSSGEKDNGQREKNLFDEGGVNYNGNYEWCFVFINIDEAKHLSNLELNDRINSANFNHICLKST